MRFADRGAVASRSSSLKLEIVSPTPLLEQLKSWDAMTAARQLAPVARELHRTGWLLIENAVCLAECNCMTAAIRDYEETGGMYRIDRKDISGRFWTFNGPEVEQNVAGSKALIANVSRLINLLPADREVRFQNSGVNVNATRPDDRMGFHYDGQELSAVLHLNSVEGGEVEIHPRRRVPDRGPQGIRKLIQRARHELLRRSPLRRHLTKPQVVQPRAGNLLIMEASVCLHRVLPVRGDETRYSIVIAYDRVARRFGGY